MRDNSVKPLLAKKVLSIVYLTVEQGVALGLGDGVGGWTEQGIDSSMFSQALMYYAHRHFENGWAGEPEIDPIAESNGTPEGITMTPSMALQLAHRDVLADSSVEAGEAFSLLCASVMLISI